MEVRVKLPEDHKLGSPKQKGTCRSLLSLKYTLHFRDLLFAELPGILPSVPWAALFGSEYGPSGVVSPPFISVALPFPPGAVVLQACTYSSSLIVALSFRGSPTGAPFSSIRLIPILGKRLRSVSFVRSPRSEVSLLATRNASDFRQIRLLQLRLDLLYVAPTSGYLLPLHVFGFRQTRRGISVHMVSSCQRARQIRPLGANALEILPRSSNFASN